MHAKKNLTSADPILCTVMHHSQKPCLPASGFALPPCHPQQARLLAAAGAQPAAKCKMHAKRVSLRSSGLEFVPSKAQLRCQSCVAVRLAFSMVHPNPTYQPMKSLSIRPCQRTPEWAGRTLQRPTAAEGRKLAKFWARMWEEPGECVEASYVSWQFSPSLRRFACKCCWKSTEVLLSDLTSTFGDILCDIP